MVITMEHILSLIGMLFTGGALVAIINKYGFGRKEKNDYMLLLIKQLQENVNTNNEEIKNLKNDVVHWRDKYYAELEEKNKLVAELRKVSAELRRFNQNQST